jgi:hypothetical protein
MRKLVFGTTFLIAALAVRGAEADVITSPYFVGAVVILLGLALAGLCLVLPVLLLSAAIRKFFSESEDDLREPPYHGMPRILPNPHEGDSVLRANS